jgi:hypothetical protein
VNKAEAAHLLALAGAFDRWIIVNDGTAEGWAYALENLPFELARVAVVEHYKGPNAHKAIMPVDVIAAVESAARLTRPQVEADVRSAKARGLVDQSWPDAQVLPDLVREQLAAAREGDRVAVLELGSPDRIGAQEFKDMEAGL